MSQKITVFNKIYLLEDAEKFDLENSIFEMFLMDSKTVLGACYFTELTDEIKKVTNFEELRNVKFVEFDNSEELSEYVNDRGRYEVIDWSTNFEKPCVLDYV